MEERIKNLRKGLIDPKKTHANCGVGVVVDLKGRKSHQIVEEGFQILVNIDHRGARGAEEKTGDGAGIMLQKPHKFFRAVVPELDEDFDAYGVGQTFLPQNKKTRDALIAMIGKTLEAEGFELITWRDVPTDNSDLGKTARDSEPVIKQFFVKAKGSMDPTFLDSKLYILRKLIEHNAEKMNIPEDELFYICSLDRRKIVYKGLLTCEQLKLYFPDLSDERVETSLALVHSRFSTNTLGAWELAHPYRSIVHNGEINTLRGNLNRMKTREAVLESPKFGTDIEKMKPIASEGTSDTAVLDNVLELLIEGGRDLPQALRMLIPEAWAKDPHMDQKKKDFYDYHSALMEPWDGPALVAVTDGYSVAAVLDRNGLRPCRYYVTKDDKLIMASEAGVLDTPVEEIAYKGRLKPGQMFLADTREGRIVPEDEIFAGLTEKPFGQWLKDNRVLLEEISTDKVADSVQIKDNEDIGKFQRTFGYTLEAMRVLLQQMAETGKDPIGAMGTDTPPAALSSKNKPLFNYFFQEFAQVSNPPLDYLREDVVTSLQCYIGKEHNLLEETPEHCRQLLVKSPILTSQEYAAIETVHHNGIRSKKIDITFEKGKTSLKEAMEGVRKESKKAIGEGFEILILTDRNTNEKRVPIPSLLAVSGLHHFLIREGLRTLAGIVLDSGNPMGVHHFCTLLGYGADAIHPWLAYASLDQMNREGWINGNADTTQLIAHYRKALQGGILKVMAKMGISTLDSYKGAQIFQVVGLNYDFVQEYFPGTVAHIQGVDLRQIEKETLEEHYHAFDKSIPGSLRLDIGGDMYWRRDGEIHQWTPYTVGKLQHAVRTDNFDSYKEYAGYINDQEERLQTIRGLLDFVVDPRKSIPLEEVEPIESIYKRFSTGSMSFGSLSAESHEALAIAMNRIGGKSGTGEGGERVDRFGTERECSMKQVASGRFGVNIHYLTRAKQIEIKMAQGAKPGEGGELPGAKVDEVIAEVRFTTPGVGLISPPPHHDIYSIEDLAQLIHDLKCSNPEAEIHVKLVSKAGVGVIAAGVAKARADSVLISGDTGGTGASVKTSIKFAGGPWELGLAETQQVLLANNLRSRIRVRADGGFKTGRDVVVAALLGAEEYGFGTAPLIALGCIMLRKCHCNTCSVGVATQNPILRAKFPGKADHVINYMKFMAMEIRELMAQMGFRSMEEMIGRVDKLKQKEIQHPKGLRLDLSQLLYKQNSNDSQTKTREQNHNLDKKIDHKLISEARPALEYGKPVKIQSKIRNSDRTTGTMLSHYITKKYGAKGLDRDTVQIQFEGSAGQSFGAFLTKGMSFHLVGEANDYVGKGLCGGRISIECPPKASYVAAENIIIGNVALYGATSGELYANGLGGERFAVRNSGALAVVEGVGDHGCEYMTGGIVVILGSTGKNFGAGMSGGEAYILDENKSFHTKLNPQGMLVQPVVSDRDEELLKRMIENHSKYTNSERARTILDHWAEYLPKFVKVIPEAYAKVLESSMESGKDLRITPPPIAEVAQAL